jgi:circadian clock protein KaiC
MPTEPVAIPTLKTGVPGLDEALGGGIPELAFVLIAGGPGCGKTTLGQQIMFANATPEKRALFFTIVGEPPLKMLRYQQQFSFFDPDKVEESIHFVHLGEEAKHGLDRVLRRIQEEVEAYSPALVVVDSFRSMMRRPRSEGDLETQDFMQHLAIFLTTYQATTVLIGEYRDDEYDNSVFTVADGIIWVRQAQERSSIVRKMQIVKMRGQGQVPGMHTMRIGRAGIEVYPRMPKPAESGGAALVPSSRLGTGTAVLDEMTGGGSPAGHSVLVTGPSGSGKTLLANQFLLEGLRRGESTLLAIFEKRPTDYLQTTPYGIEMENFVRAGKLEVLYLRPFDLSIDETLMEMQNAVLRLGAKRAVIDSLSGLELALAGTFREDFRESLYRMVGGLTGMGVTVMSTVEHPDSFTGLQFSPHGIAFLSDAIIMQRYVEMKSELRRIIGVVKVRGSQHSKELRTYEVSSDGTLIIGEALRDYEGLLGGTTTRFPDEDG